MDDRNVIIAYDGRPNGNDALALGKQFCEVLAATPVLFICVQFPSYVADPSERELESAVDTATKPLFEDAKARLAPLPVETRGVLGESPALQLQELAEDLTPLAIVVGSGHRGALGRVLLGSVGEKLLSVSPCPVAVAPRGYSARCGEHLLQIGVAVDGGEEANRALTHAIGLAERLHASLTILSVLGLPPIGLGGFPSAPVGDLGRIQRKHTAQVLEAASARVPKGVPVKVQRLEGDPAQSLARASEEFDLMLIGSRGHGPLRRVLLGSVSVPLMRAARCPLMITPREAEGDPFGFDRAADLHALARGLQTDGHQRD